MAMKTVAIIQARLASTRLPGKVLFELAGRSMLQLIIERLSRSQRIDQVIVATGDGKLNDAIAYVAESVCGVPCVRGPEDDVLRRYAMAAEATDASRIVRVTGDCPFVDPGVIDDVIDLQERNSLDYTTNVKPETWPDGLDVSVFSREVLELADAEADLRSEREHVVPWMWKHSNFEGGTRLEARNLAAPEDLSSLRWTVDDPLDYRLARAIADRIGSTALVDADWRRVLESFRELSPMMTENQAIQRDAGYLKSLRDELKDQSE